MGLNEQEWSADGKLKLIRTVDESSRSIGQASVDGTMCEPSRQANSVNGIATSSSAAIRVRKTAEPESESQLVKRRLAVSLSELLMRFARELWFARIQRKQGLMLPGLGGDFDPNWNDLVTLCCPSNLGHVALGRTDSENGCSCSLKGPTPCARDWKDSGDMEQVRRHYLRNLAEKRGSQFPRWVAFHHGFVPGPTVYEVALGFPEGWTEIESKQLETP